MAMADSDPSPTPDLPGFERLPNDIYIRRIPSSLSVTRPPSHPRYVLIFGWGDGLPKHIRKYADGYLALFPSTPQIVVISLIHRCMFRTKAQRASLMRCIVDEVYPRDLVDDDNVLVQSMSNLGGSYYTGTAHAYEAIHGHPLPHRVQILDSNPGHAHWTPRNLFVWGTAMALRISKRFHLPFPIAQLICMGIFCVNRVSEFILREDFFGECARKGLTDELYVSPSVRRLYLYGKSDEVISWKEIEEHVASTREIGIECDAVVFEGSNHVSHMRRHPEQYWAAIADSWSKASAKL